MSGSAASGDWDRTLTLLFLRGLVGRRGLVIGKIVPVLPIVSTKADSGIVIGLPNRRAIVRVLIRVRGRVHFAAISGSDRVPIFCLIGLVSGHVFVPCLFVMYGFTRLFQRVPIRQRQASVCPTANASANAGHVFVASDIPRDPVSSRTRSYCNASFPIDGHLVVSIGVLRRFQ